VHVDFGLTVDVGSEDPDILLEKMKKEVDGQIEFAIKEMDESGRDLPATAKQVLKK
jgi:hypothetical protein